MTDYSSFWSDLSTGKKLSLLVGVVAIVAGSFFAFRWLTAEPYQVLFKDLEARDASNVVTELEQRKIDYRFENGGSDILIPESLVHEVRIKLMGSNMPMMGGVGFEVFDNADFGMTEFVQKINYQRALEGELTRTIMALSEVRYARVHLVMLEEGLFQQKDRPAQASVTLFTHDGQTLTPRKILGMQRLVAASVPGLSPSEVIITDQEGVVLSEDVNADPSTLAVTDRLRQKQAVEDYLIGKAADVLASTFVDDKAAVSIDAELDFSQVSTSSEVVLPGGSDGNGAVVRRRESRNGGLGSEGERALTTEIEYRLGTQRETRTVLPGKISRLTVGVIVPSDTSEVRRSEIQKIVEMAVGFDGTRGDVIAVSVAEAGPALPVSAQVNDALSAQAPIASSFEPPQETASTAAASERPFETISAWVRAHPLVLLAVFVLSIVSLLLSLLLLRKKVRVTEEPQRLSESDRERLLLEIQDWVARDSQHANGVN